MRRMMVRSVGALAVLGLALAACGSDDEDDSASPSGVDVTLTDFKITLSSATAAAGKVTFDVTNDGPSVHEFVVFKTDLAPDELPTNADGDVEEGESFEPVDEIEDIEEGADPSLEVDLDAGHYVLVCNLPTHYGNGMSAELTVS